MPPIRGASLFELLDEDDAHLDDVEKEDHDDVVPVPVPTHGAQTQQCTEGRCMVCVGHCVWGLGGAVECGDHVLDLCRLLDGTVSRLFQFEVPHGDDLSIIVRSHRDAGLVAAVGDDEGGGVFLSSSRSRDRAVRRDLDEEIALGASPERSAVEMRKADA